MTTTENPTSLRIHLTQYLLLRNRLGHELAYAARLLPRFVTYLEDLGHSTVTIADALAWCQQPPSPPGSSVWPRRMGAVRGFARYLSGIDPATEVPPIGLLPSRRRWRPPFIYSSDDIAALLGAAAALPSPRRAATYSTCSVCSPPPACESGKR